MPLRRCLYRPLQHRRCCLCLALELPFSFSVSSCEHVWTPVSRFCSLHACCSLCLDQESSELWDIIGLERQLCQLGVRVRDETLENPGVVEFRLREVCACAQKLSCFNARTNKGSLNEVAMISTVATTGNE